jgi:dCMP deaminase
MILKYEPFSNYVPPSWDVLFMRMVYEIAAKSKDPKTKYGAVVVRDNRPFLFGYNGISKGVQDLPERMERPLKYLYTAHAERNCTYQAADMGISTRGATMYTQSIPCTGCTIAICQSKIKELVIHGPWMEYSYHFENQKPDPKWKEEFEISKIMLNEAGVTVRSFDEVLGLIGYLNGYTVHI